MKDLISFAIGYMACLAAWVLVFECLINIYWMWIAFVVATCAAGAAYELTFKYTKNVVIPMTSLFARGAVLLISDGTKWIRSAARRDHVWTARHETRRQYA